MPLDEVARGSSGNALSIGQTPASLHPHVLADKRGVGHRRCSACLTEYSGRCKRGYRVPEFCIPADSRLWTGPGAYSRALICQSEAPIKAWYSAGVIDRLEYRQLITNMFLSCCQSLLITSHSKVPPELTVIVRISPGFGMALSSTSLPNRTSLFAIVSGVSFPSRRTRREGILRLISTVCAICWSESRTPSCMIARVGWLIAYVPSRAFPIRKRRRTGPS
jgi:hypothetical protein